eukprot:255974_1
MALVSPELAAVSSQVALVSSQVASVSSQAAPVSSSQIAAVSSHQQNVSLPFTSTISSIDTPESSKSELQNEKPCNSTDIVQDRSPTSIISSQFGGMLSQQTIFSPQESGASNNSKSLRSNVATEQSCSSKITHECSPMEVVSLQANTVSAQVKMMPSQPSMVFSKAAMMSSQPAMVSSQPDTVSSQAAMVQSQAAAVSSQATTASSQPAMVSSRAGKVSSQQISDPLNGVRAKGGDRSLRIVIPSNVRTPASRKIAPAENTDTLRSTPSRYGLRKRGKDGKLLVISAPNGKMCDISDTPDIQDGSASSLKTSDGPGFPGESLSEPAKLMNSPVQPLNIHIEPLSSPIPLNSLIRPTNGLTQIVNNMSLPINGLVQPLNLPVQPLYIPIQPPTNKPQTSMTPPQKSSMSSGLPPTQICSVTHSTQSTTNTSTRVLRSSVRKIKKTSYKTGSRQVVSSTFENPNPKGQNVHTQTVKTPVEPTDDSQNSIFQRMSAKPTPQVSSNISKRVLRSSIRKSSGLVDTPGRKHSKERPNLKTPEIQRVSAKPRQILGNSRRILRSSTRKTQQKETESKPCKPVPCQNESPVKVVIMKPLEYDMDPAGSNLEFSESSVQPVVSMDDVVLTCADYTSDQKVSKKFTEKSENVLQNVSKSMNLVENDIVPM